MNIHCSDCHVDYDDTYRDTSCPHDTFNMHTVVHGSGLETLVVVNLEDLQVVQDYFSGRSPDYNYLHAIQSMEHVHKAGVCITPNRSGRLVETW